MKDEKKRAYAYMEAWNGMIVRVPMDHLKQWKAKQEEIRKNPEAYKPDPEMGEALKAKLDKDFGRCRKLTPAIQRNNENKGE